MSKCIDETGNKYGKLTVIKRAENDVRGQARWECLCECGNTTIVCGTKLRKGLTVSCGCHMRSVGHNNLKDITGQRFGKLIVLRQYGKTDYNQITWLCRCDCGNEIVVRGYNLTSYNSTSCGCTRSSAGELKIEQLLKNHNINYIKEKTFEDLTYNNNKLRYDFFLADYNLLIEFDGLQHFKETHYFKQSYEENHKRDIIKNEYAKLKDIKLIRIPYYDLKKFTFEDIFNDKYKI